MEKDAIFAGELFEGDGYERANAANYEDLVMSARQRLVVTSNHLKRK